MFSRQEASKIKEEFWTTFGKYMSPIPSAEGVKINWINYHTKVKDVYFRMDAGKDFATISISLEQKDPAIQELYFEQFLELKSILRSELQEHWEWKLHATAPDGKVVSTISKSIGSVSIFKKEDWGELITFFKPRIIALDAFWENARYSFDALR